MTTPDATRAARTQMCSRLLVLTNLRCGTSAQRHERMFGLGALEGRMLQVLGAHRGLSLSLKEIEGIGGIEKAHAGRTIAALVSEGLVTKTPDALDRRAVRLTLTEPGRVLYEAVRQDALARDDELLAVLSPGERTAFVSCLDRLTEQARRLADEESLGQALPLAKVSQPSR